MSNRKKTKKIVKLSSDTYLKFKYQILLVINTIQFSVTNLNYKFL